MREMRTGRRWGKTKEMEGRIAASMAMLCGPAGEAWRDVMQRWAGQEATMDRIARDAGVNYESVKRVVERITRETPNSLDEAIEVAGWLFFVRKRMSDREVNARSVSLYGAAIYAQYGEYLDEIEGE